MWQKQNQLRGLSRVGQRENHIVPRDHSEVAMTGLGRMHEKRRRACARERGGDLAGDVSRLADPGHDDPALARQTQLAGIREQGVQARQ